MICQSSTCLKRVVKSQQVSKRKIDDVNEAGDDAPVKKKVTTTTIKAPVKQTTPSPLKRPPMRQQLKLNPRRPARDN